MKITDEHHHRQQGLGATPGCSARRGSPGDTVFYVETNGIGTAPRQKPT